MALILPKSVFLHIPKVGGLWVRAAIARAGIKTFEYGDQHTHFRELFRYVSEKFFRRKLVFSFVRHPASWYQSRWLFRMKTGWQMQHPLDYFCASNDFETFVRNCLAFKPSGWVTFEYSAYLKTIPDMVRFVGRQEALADDLVRVLRLAGESFDEGRLRETPRVNESDLDGKPSSFWARYSPELLNAVLAAEDEIIREYYSDINPSSLGCLYSHEHSAASRQHIRA